jgi:hypothetical protein
VQDGDGSPISGAQPSGRPSPRVLAVASVWLMLLAVGVLAVAIGVVVAVLRGASGWYVAGILVAAIVSVLLAIAGMWQLDTPRWRWMLFAVATAAVTAAGVLTGAAVR